MIQKKPMRIAFLLIFMFCCFGFSNAHAAPLGLSLHPPTLSGLIYKGDNTLVHNSSGTTSFYAQGIPDRLDTISGSPIPVSDVSMTLTVDLKTSGTLDAPGMIEFFGTIPALGITTPSNLLTGDLDAFGFAAFSIFEFTFTISGGSLSPLFGGLGTQGGVIISAGAFTGSLEDDYSNPSFEAFDVGLTSAVPLPSAILLLFSGVLAVVGYLRK